MNSARYCFRSCSRSTRSGLAGDLVRTSTKLVRSQEALDHRATSLNADDPLAANQDHSFMVKLCLLFKVTIIG